MSKTKRWMKQIINLLLVACVLWIALSILEIGGSSCAIAGRDYSPLNLIGILFYAFG